MKIACEKLQNRPEAFIFASKAVVLRWNKSSGTASAQMAMPDPSAVLARFDTNKDGSISKDEWTAAGRPAERFDIVDADHDGKVSVAELTQAMAKMQGQRPAN